MAPTCALDCGDGADPITPGVFLIASKRKTKELRDSKSRTLLLITVVITSSIFRT